MYSEYTLLAFIIILALIQRYRAGIKRAGVIRTILKNVFGNLSFFIYSVCCILTGVIEAGVKGPIRYNVLSKEFRQEV